MLLMARDDIPSNKKMERDMKTKHLTNCVALALSLVAVSASAATTDFQMHGYIRSGILLNKDGNRVNTLNPLTYGEWRLGNEQNTKIELTPTIILTSDSGVIAKVHTNLTHETKCTADWNCVDGDGHELQVREGYSELQGLPFAPNMVFWAGKRYSSSNTSSHQYDWEYIQYNGTGGGFDKADLGFARLDFGVYAFTPSGENQADPVNKTQQGYPEDVSANMWLKSIGGTGLDLQFVAHTMNKNDWRTNAAEKGYGMTAVYNFADFYKIANGYSRAVFQYGTGLAAGDSLGKNGWGFANSSGTKSWRGVLDGMASLGKVDVATFAFYQSDSDYAPWTNAVEGAGNDRDLWAVGFRPQHQITANFAMQYELGYEYMNVKGTDVKGGMTKATIAPTLTFESGFWSRPQLRVFATYAKWDNGLASKLDKGYTRNGDTDTLNFGMVGEVWF